MVQVLVLNLNLNRQNQENYENFAENKKHLFAFVIDHKKNMWNHFSKWI